MRILFTKDLGSEITGYRIYRGVKEGDLRFYTNISAKTDSFNDTNLEEGTNYSYSVSALNKIGESPMSTLLTITAGMIRPDLPRPENPLVVPGNGYVVITFESPRTSDELYLLNYNIYRSNSGENFNILSSTGQTRYKDHLVTNGITYEYRITAVYTKGESGPTPVVSATPDEVYSPFEIPQDLTALPGDGWVSLSWREPNDERNGSIARYNLFRGITEDDVEFIGFVNSPLMSFLDTDLENGKSYLYYVSALYISGESDLAGPVRVTPRKVVQLPGKPLDFSVHWNGSFIRLEWSGPIGWSRDDLAGFKIYRSATSGSPMFLDEVPGDVRNFTDLTISPGETYRYSVSALSYSGEGPRTAELSATIPREIDDDGRGEELFKFSSIYIIITVVGLVLIIGIVFFFLSRNKSRRELVEE